MQICGEVPVKEFGYNRNLDYPGVCFSPSCNVQASAMRCGNSMSRLEEKIEGQNGNEEYNVPISRMMSANEYQTNQLALQKKAGLAKHNA